MDNQHKGLLTTDKENTWQYLSPIAVVYFAFSSLKGLASNFIYILPGLAVSYNSLKQSEHLWWWLTGVLALILLYAVLSFVFYRYRLSNNTVEIRSGVLAKKHINLPFDKIQNIQLEQPIFYRLTGFTCMQLDTAGSFKQEAKVVALPVDFAHQLKQTILRHKDQATNQQTIESEGQSPNEQLLNKRSVKDLVLHGISNNQIWILLGAMAPIYDNLADYISDGLSTLGIDLAHVFNLQTHAWWQLTLYAISLTMFIMLLLALLSVIGSIVIHYGFTLSKTDDRYIRRSGLFTRQEVSMRLSRLQLLVRKQDWLDVLLNRINLRLEQNNTTMQGQESLGSTSKILVPSIKPDECTALLQDAMPGNVLEQIQYRSISKRFILRNYLIWLPAPVFTAAVCMFLSQWQLALVAGTLSVLFMAAVLLRWYRWGFAWDTHYVYVRKGLLGIDYYCFPIFKVQQSKFLQSVLMKRKHLASCSLVLASGAITIPFMAECEARKLIDTSLYIVESKKQSWM